MQLAASEYQPFGKTGLRLPPIMFGTGALGNERRVISEQTKAEICGEWFRHVAPPVFIDISARLVDDSLALERLARRFQRLDVAPEEIVIGNRLRWNDRRIGYDAVFASWDETCRLLGGHYRPQLVAIDAADEYLAVAQSPADRRGRFQDILEACRALEELKAAQQVAGIGVAAKDWHAAREIHSAVRLDWLMLAGAFTIMRHPPELLEFMAKLAARQIAIINAGIFQYGYLLGANFIDRRAVNREHPADKTHLAWRKAFTALCHGHGITPAHACLQFALAAPGVAAVAVNTSHPDRVAQNVSYVREPVPASFWASMKEERLLAEGYPYLRYDRDN